MDNVSVINSPVLRFDKTVSGIHITTFHLVVVFAISFILCLSVKRLSFLIGFVVTRMLPTRSSSIVGLP